MASIIGYVETLREDVESRGDDGRQVPRYDPARSPAVAGVGQRCPRPLAREAEKHDLPESALGPLSSLMNAQRMMRQGLTELLDFHPAGGRFSRRTASNWNSWLGNLVDNSASSTVPRANRSRSGSAYASGSMRSYGSDPGGRRPYPSTFAPDPALSPDRPRRAARLWRDRAPDWRSSSISSSATAVRVSTSKVDSGRVDPRRAVTLTRRRGAMA